MKKASLIFTQFILGITLMTAQTSIHDFSFKTIDGQEKSFADFSGKKIMVVNTASECGYTPQYKALQAVHEQYGDKLVIVGFPANNFGQQEPGTNSEIASFCEKNYGVTFLMAEKVSVKGDDIHPLFKWLTAQKNDSFDGDIKWNFEKFLLDEAGKLIARFRSGVEPDHKDILNLLK
ncbi:MAG: glutathione peroxidase [Bacteroidetes bacterium]|nr:glutathione peroxidase [Bacteroidota bacterium]